MANPGWEFMMTSQFICTPAERAAGYRIGVYPAGTQPRRAVAVARFAGAVAVSAAAGRRRPA